jgi:hypothetical protein
MYVAGGARSRNAGPHEPGAGDEVAMLSRYSHVRMEAKRRALDEIAARQRQDTSAFPEGAAAHGAHQ